MDCERAFAILASLAQRQNGEMTGEELEDLVSRGLVRSVDKETKARMDSEVSGIAAIASRVQNLRRSLDSVAGSRGLFRREGIAPHEASRIELREIEVRLEEATRTKSTVDSLVWDASAETYVQITFQGRRALSDLAVRRYRLAGASFDEFLEGLRMLRAGLEATVRRSAQILVSISTFNSSISKPALRVPALILAKQGIDTIRYAAAFNRIFSEIRSPSAKDEDLLMAAAFLASLPTTDEDVLQRFEDLRKTLRSTGQWNGVEVLLAASLIDLQPEILNDVLQRLNALHIDTEVVNALNLIGLARSPYSTEEALQRYDGVKSALEGRGYRGGEDVAAAFAVLASAQQPVEVLAERFAELSGQLHGMFDPPHVAAAMLASNPLDPSESMDLLKEAAGAITRGSFFEGTMEIEGLAMVMLYGQAVEAARLLPESVAPPAGAVSPESYLYQQGNSWYLWHNYWFYRPTLFYIRTHPLHFHTVPHFG